MLICAVDTCFAALSDDFLLSHYLHQVKGVCPKDDSYSQSIMKYLNVITCRKKELVVLSTELQKNYNQNRNPVRLVAKHKIAHFCCFDPDFLSQCEFMEFSYILSITYPAREII